MKLGVDHDSDIFNLGSNVLFEAFFEFLNWGDDGGMHVFIDGGNIGIELSHFLLGLCEIRLQGIEASFQVFAMGMGHDDEGTEKGWVGSKKFLKKW